MTSPTAADPGQVVVRVRLTYAAMTHVGLERKENQDAVVIDGLHLQAPVAQKAGCVDLEPARTWSAAVVDGMGGYAGGQVAALLAASVLAHKLVGLTTSADGGAHASAYEAASRAIADVASSSTGLENMGATACALVVDQDRFCVSNLGDSRIYRFWRGRYLSQLSIDDRVGPGDHAITQALGRHLQTPADPHHLVIDLDAETTLLLCSDGLTDLVDDDEIKTILMSWPDAQDAANRLVDAALANGGLDNISLLIVQATDGEVALT